MQRAWLAYYMERCESMVQVAKYVRIHEVQIQCDGTYDRMRGMTLESRRVIYTELGRVIMERVDMDASGR